VAGKGHDGCVVNEVFGLEHADVVDEAEDCECAGSRTYIVSLAVVYPGNE
jgi:hypothetical protein